MMTETNERINAVVEQVKHQFGKGIVDALKSANQNYLKGKGKVASQPKIDQHNLRWSLAWKEDKISYDLNLVVGIEDNGKTARVDKVWLHRHASTDFDFDGHTPTTRMKRLTGLSIDEIKQAIDGSFK